MNTITLSFYRGFPMGISVAPVSSGSVVPFRRNVPRVPCPLRSPDGRKTGLANVILWYNNYKLYIVYNVILCYIYIYANML